MPQKIRKERERGGVTSVSADGGVKNLNNPQREGDDGHRWSSKTAGSTIGSSAEVSVAFCRRPSRAQQGGGEDGQNRTHTISAAGLSVIGRKCADGGKGIMKN